MIRKLNMSLGFLSITRFVMTTLVCASFLCSLNVHAQEEVENGQAKTESGENGAWDKAVHSDGVGMSAGVAMGIGPSMMGDADRAETGGTFLAAIRAGVLIRRLEIQLEIAPKTYFLKFGMESALATNITLGSLVHIKGDLYLPIRFGVGYARWDDENAFQARVDLIGVAYKMGRWYFELSAPSFRLTAFHLFKFKHWGWPITFSAYREF